MKPKTERIKLTEDHAFKLFFRRNEQMLASLLKSFLPIDEDISDIEIIDQEKIEGSDENSLAEQVLDLSIEDSTILAETKRHKQAVLDLRVRLGNDEQVNVEMQAAPTPDFIERMLFYWGRLYTNKLKKGEKYKNLTTTYSLVFANFTVLDYPEVTDYINSASIRLDEYPHIRLCKQLRIIIVELNKVPEDYRQLLDLRRMWCYILKYYDCLTEAAYEYLSQKEDIKMGLGLLDNLTQEEVDSLERDAIEKMEIYRLGLVENAKVASRAEGKAEGKAEVALQMLQKDCSYSLISEVTGLSKTEINRLKNGN